MHVTDACCENLIRYSKSSSLTALLRRSKRDRRSLEQSSLHLSDSVDVHFPLQAILKVAITSGKVDANEFLLALATIDSAAS